MSHAEILPGIHVRQAATQRTARTEPATRHGWSSDWTAPYLLDGERIQSRFSSSTRATPTKRCRRC